MLEGSPRERRIKIEAWYHWYDIDWSKIITSWIPFKIIPYCILDNLTYMMGAYWYLACDSLSRSATILADDFQQVYFNDWINLTTHKIVSIIFIITRYLFNSLQLIWIILLENVSWSTFLSIYWSERWNAHCFSVIGITSHRSCGDGCRLSCSLVAVE